MKRVRSSYSTDFKIKAVELSNHKGNMTLVAKELGIPRDSLKRWKKEFENGKFTTAGPNPLVKSKEEQELILLKKELSEVKLERDILKKAVGIFSKSDR